MRPTREQRLENVVRALLLFYSPQPWTHDRAEEWFLLTGEHEATSRALCDAARFALATDPDPV